MRVRWGCGRCGARGTTAVETRVVFHRCTPPTRRIPIRRRYSAPTVDERRSALWFDAFSDALEPDALLRRVDE